MQPCKTLDLRAQICPMTFVRTRLALDSMQPGETLLVQLEGEDPQTRVPRTIEQLGHRILNKTLDADGVMHVLVLKRGGAA